MERLQKLKGTRDILPAEAPLWRYIEQAVHETMRLYGYAEIRTPTFELTTLFARSIGQITDIVSKEMYTFTDRSEKSITLKPEGTAPVIRAYIENSLGARRPVNKFYYIAPMFRQENPQAGRFREFHQFGAELIGAARPHADVETILLLIDIYRSVGLSSFHVKINSVGDPACRDAYKQKLQAYLLPHFEQLCNACKERFDKNPLRLLDCKEEACRAATEGAPKMVDYLDPEAELHFRTVLQLLEQNGIQYEVDHRLVRGLDYYTRTAYEVINDSIGAQNALGGGGRYDLLAEELGGKPTPAVGFAAGIERLMMVLGNEHKLPDLRRKIDVFIACIGEPAAAWAVHTARQFRQNGVSVDMDMLGRSLKAQLKEANRSHATFALIVGDQELESGTLALRHLEKSEQFEIPLDQAVEVFLKRFRSDA